jgi:hypothetical protein
LGNLEAIFTASRSIAMIHDMLRLKLCGRETRRRLRAAAGDVEV